MSGATGRSGVRAATGWYREAVIYAVQVQTFRDSDGDGCGDFRGLAQSLDYLRDHGVNCLWLLPFYVSGGRDNGYDIVDHRAIERPIGTFDDFHACMAEAKRRGFRVILDLVGNHTSDQHP